MNHYLIQIDVAGNKLVYEIVADNEKHAKKKIKESIKFDVIRPCEKGALERLKKLQKEKTNENEIHTTS